MWLGISERSPRSFDQSYSVVPSPPTRAADNIMCCRSGSAADTQAVTDYVRYYLDLHRQEIGNKAPRVKTAANLISGMVYANKVRWVPAGGGVCLPGGGGACRWLLCCGNQAGLGGSPMFDGFASATGSNHFARTSSHDAHSHTLLSLKSLSPPWSAILTNTRTI